MSLLLRGIPARLLRITCGVAFLAALFLFLGPSGGFASEEAPSASNQSPAKGSGLLSGILNPVSNLVDTTLGQVPVVGDITGSDTVGKVLAPVTALTDELEKTIDSVPILESVTTPVREVTTTVVPPVTNGISDVTTPIFGVVEEVTAPVVQVVAPVVDPVTDTLKPVVGGVTDEVAGTVDQVVDTVVTPVLDKVVTPVVDTVVTPILPALPAEPAVPETPTAPDLPGNPAPEPPAGVDTPAVPADPSAPLAPVIQDGTGPAGVDPWDISGSNGSTGIEQVIAEQESVPAASKKERPNRSAGNTSPASDLQEAAAQVRVDSLSRYMTAAIFPETSTASGPAVTAWAMIGVGSPVPASCGSNDSGLAVGPCAPAPAVSPAPGSASQMSSGAAGGPAGSAAAHENLSGQFHLHGPGVASPIADWALPASMPSNPGSTPG